MQLFALVNTFSCNFLKPFVEFWVIVETRESGNTIPLLWIAEAIKKRQSRTQI